MTFMKPIGLLRMENYDSTLGWQGCEEKGVLMCCCCYISLQRRNWATLHKTAVP